MPLSSKSYTITHLKCDNLHMHGKYQFKLLFKKNVITSFYLTICTYINSHNCKIKKELC